MKFYRMFVFNLVAILFVFAQQGIVQDAAVDEQQMSLDTYLELLKVDIKGKKIVLINDAITFTSEEEKKFWPLYNKYDAEMAKLFDTELNIIKEYAEAYDNMSGELAENLLNRSLDIDKRRVEIKEKYFKKFKEVLPTVKAVKFFQVDRRIQMLIELQIMANVPVLGETKKVK
ncbi:MAG TPA: hypothetical protein EYP36_13375 [Calditrichaeota bacterium]|nr:hypothetical protein [Calditrichota bacterium]